MQQTKLYIAAVLTVCVIELSAQTSVVPTPDKIASNAPSSYILGPQDQVSIYVGELTDEFADKTFRIDSSGDLSLPVAGHVQAAGLTARQLEAAIKDNLRVMKNPQVSVSIIGFGSQSVSVLGAVNSPGIHQLEGHKTLVDMLSASGGLRPDAGYVVNITRNLRWGIIPIPGASIDDAGKSSVASIKLKEIINATGPEQNIVILPDDIITVPKADIVYAVGSVVKPGGFPLNEHETLSALQVVSLAEGLQRTAASDKAKILRSIPGNPERIEISVNLKQLMAGKGLDITLQANDILFIPNSTGKSVEYRTLDAIVNAASGLGVIATRF